MIQGTGSHFCYILGRGSAGRWTIRASSEIVYYETPLVDCGACTFLALIIFVYFDRLYGSSFDQDTVYVDGASTGTRLPCLTI